MIAREPSRRSFLKQSVSGSSTASVAANCTVILEVEDFVQQAARSGAPAKFQFFPPEQATEIEVMSALIIPTDETAGARRDVDRVPAGGRATNLPDGEQPEDVRDRQVHRAHDVPNLFIVDGSKSGALPAKRYQEGDNINGFA